MRKTRRIFAFLLALTIALPMIPILQTQAADGSDITKITVVKGKDINDMQYGGKEVLHSSAWWYDEDGNKNPAFCVDPTKAGPGEYFAGKYDLNVAGAETNEKVTAIINNSIPYKSYQELGVDSEEEAYAATKAAIWCVIGVSNYTDRSKWSAPNKPKVEALFNKLVDFALNNPEPVKHAVYGTAKVDQEPVEEGNYFVQRFKVKETTNSGKEITKYTVELTGNYPTGTIITGEDGIERTQFKGDENFAVRIPKTSVPVDGNAEANVKISANLYSNVILIGKPMNGLDGKVQDMEIAIPNQPVTMSTKMVIGKPTEPGESGGGSGQLTVIKLDARDNATPLAGVTFDCYNSSGQLIDTGTTDASGKWIPQITGAGTYTIIERSTNNKYQLTEPTSQVITVQKDKTATATFRDYPSQTVTMEKEDAVTGDSVAGCEYEIVRIDGKGAWRATGKTDGSGKITWDDVPDGTYLVREVSTVEGYILDQTPQYVTVRNGQAPSLKFLDSKYPGLTITKVDKQTGEVIKNPATFRVEQVDGDYSADVTTNNGVATLKNIPVGSYKITEKSAPEGYVVDGCPDSVSIGENESKQHIIYNLKKPVLTIEKIDAQTGEPVAGTQFEIKKSDGTKIGTVETGKDGTVTVGMKGGELGYLDPDTYTVTEVFVPAPYVLSGEHQDIQLKAGDTKTLLFSNLEKPIITVEKYDEKTGEKLAGAQFAVYEQSDQSRPVVEGVTDADGRFTTGYIAPGTYVVKELNPPDGYMFSDKTDPERVIVAKAGDGEIIVKVDNIKLPTLIIQKTDGTTNKGIPNTTYQVEYENPNGGLEQLGTFKTDANGRITLPNVKSGWYVITETIPAQGYQKPTNPVTRIYLAPGANAYLNLDTSNGSTGNNDVIENGSGNEAAGNPTTGTADSFKITSGADYEIVDDVVNYPLNSIVIKKADANTGEMLDGATFEVFRISGETSGQNGKLICTVTTDHSGVVVITGLEAGAYAVRETKAPANYIIAETDLQTVNLKADGTSVVEVVFRNYPYGALSINKVDGTTKQPLAGAKFKIVNSDGALVGNYTSDVNGNILVPNLKPDSYTVTEIAAPDGYALQTEPQTIKIGTSGKTETLTFINEKQLGVQIIKIDSETRQPLQGAQFQIWHTGASSSTSVAAGTPAGTLVGTYTTDINGVINVVLEAGTYEILETKAPEGYQLDNHKQDIVVKDGQQTSVTFTNTKLPDGTILIHKTDSKTGDPIEGVEFEIRKENGELIAQEETDRQGEITVTDLEEGVYYVKETKEQEGYKADLESRKVVLGESGFVKVEIENDPLCGLRLKKIDSVTGKGIYGVEFALYDKNGKIVGNYFTDNKGIIDFDAELPEGRYTIKEITPADGYYADDTPRTVELRAGKITEITWENTSQAGQIKIKKVSGDYNETNALPKGTALQGAIFEIYDYKTGNVVDRIETDYYGIANSKPLPLGRYIIKEVQAPAYYKINPEEIDITIEFATQILNITVEDYAANVSVAIDKVGPYEVMQGQPAIYTIKNVRNSSSVPLNDFYWRDLIPTSAGTLDKIITGTYNMQGRYKVVATTSAGNTRVLADNLDTTKNNVVFCSPAAVGLSSGEYITSVSLMFGTVQPGFTQVLDAQIYMNVKKNGLPSGYTFANKADVGGKYGNEWATSNATWVTMVYNPTATKLPKTGW